MGLDLNLVLLSEFRSNYGLKNKKGIYSDGIHLTQPTLAM